MTAGGTGRVCATEVGVHERLDGGDPDLEPDEIQAAIDKAEQKRRELLDTQPAAKRSAKMIAILPKAADAYRRLIAQGLQDDPRAAGKARALLRKLLGTVRLVPEGTELWLNLKCSPECYSGPQGRLVAGAGYGCSIGPIELRKRL